MSARARISRRFIPPERVRVRSSFFSVSEKVSKSSFDRSRRSLAGHSEVAAVEVEGLLDRQEEVDVQLLRRQSDRGAGFLVVVDGVVAEDPDIPRSGHGEARRAMDQRGLAGAVRAQEAEERAIWDLQRDVAKRLDAGRVALRQSFDVKRVHARIIHLQLRLKSRALIRD